jgi:hypothetical protein
MSAIGTKSGCKSNSGDIIWGSYCKKVLEKSPKNRKPGDPKRGRDRRVSIIAAPEG